MQEGDEAEKVRAGGEGTDDVCAVESCLHNIHGGGYQERTPANTDAGSRVFVTHAGDDIIPGQSTRTRTGHARKSPSSMFAFKLRAATPLRDCRSRAERCSWKRRHKMPCKLNWCCKRAASYGTGSKGRPLRGRDLAPSFPHQA